jgi:hypothetical protein
MAGMHSSAYAPPLNYNQPTEVVGGYDAQINPMTGQEIPQTNFARGGNVNSEAGLASLLASRGRNGDSMLVHMAPNEVKGLQSLAMAHGGSLTVNPDTGLVEANFLKKLLPTVLGFGLNFLFPGLGALGSAALVGAGETIRTKGDLGKGLMAGLGAFGGAGLSAGLTGAAAAGSPSALTGVTSNAAANRAAIEAARTGAAQAATSTAAQTTGTEVAKQTALQKLQTMGQGVKALGNQFGRAGFVSAIPGGTAGVAAGGMGLANAATPEYEQPDLSKTIDRSYYESYGYSPEEGRFLGGQWRTGYPDFPGYAEGGDVNKDKATSSMAQYQTAPADPASFAAYLQDLNKYVASPVAPPQAASPPATTPPTRTGPPGRDGFRDFDGVDFSGIDFGNFMGGGMNGLAGIINNNFRGNDSRMQWDPDTGSFIQPGMNRPQPPAPATLPQQPSYDFSGYAGRGGREFDTEPMAYDTSAYQQPEPVYQPPAYQEPEVRDFIPRGMQDEPVFDYAPPVYEPPAYQQPEPVFDYMPPAYERPAYQEPEVRDFIPRTTQDEPVFDYTPPTYTPFDYLGTDLGVEQEPYQPQIVDEDSMGGLPSIARRGKLYYAGGDVQYAAAGKLLRGPGDGMSDDIKANISGKQEARLADGEFVIPADVVSHLGNGSSEAGSRRLYKMMADIRKARTGKRNQAPAVNVDRHVPKT